MPDEIKLTAGNNAIQILKARDVTINATYQTRQPAPRPGPDETGRGPLVSVPNLPDHFLFRPADFSRAKTTLISAILLGDPKIVAVQGMGGVGKSVLAAALAHDDDVRRAFPDGIIWLTLGQEPQIVNRQIHLSEALGYVDANYQDEQHGKAILNTLLADKKCLIVLDDVWQLAHAHAFNCLGESARLLLTTRNLEIVQSLGADPIQLDVLSDEQALGLLADCAGQPIENLLPEAHFVAKECGNLPLALAMVGAIVQRNPESWGAVLRRLKNAQLDRIHQEFPNYPYPNMLSVIQVSVDALPHQPIDLHICYLALAVFPEGVPIPEFALRTCWGLDDLDTADALDILSARSLARMDDRRCLTLHDLQRDYLLMQTTDLPALHRKLLQAFAVSLPPAISCPPWHKLSPVTPYIWDHLVYHHVQAGEWDDLYHLLTDIDFLEARCRAASVFDLERDFRQAIHAWQGQPEMRKILFAFEDCLRLESHHIHKAPELLFPILYNSLSHLGIEDPTGAIDHFCEAGRQSRHNWLRLAYVSPPAPPETGETLEGFAEAVHSIALIAGKGQNDFRILSGARNGTVSVWEPSGGKLLRTQICHRTIVYAVAATPDGSSFVTASDDQTARIWEFPSGRLLRILEGHSHQISCMSITPDGLQVVTGSYEGLIVVWDLPTGRKLRVIDTSVGPLWSFVITPDGKQLITTAENGINVWDFSSGKLIRAFEQSGNIHRLALSPNGLWLAAENNHIELSVWRLATGERLHTLDWGKVRAYSNDENRWAYPSTMALVFSPDGTSLIASDNVGTVCVWDLLTGEATHIVSVHPAWALAVTIHPDGEQVILGMNDGTIRIWTPVQGSIRYFSPYQETPLSDLDTEGAYSLTGNIALAMSEDGSQIAAMNQQGEVKIYHSPATKPLHTYEGFATWRTALGRSQDGWWVAFYAGEDTFLQNTEGGSLPCNLSRDRSVNGMKFSADGSLLAQLVGDGSVYLFETASGKLWHSIKTDQADASAIAISGMERPLLVTTRYCRSITVWDLTTDEPLYPEVEWIPGIPLAAAITPNGSQILIGSDDFMLRVWDVQSFSKQVQSRVLFANDSSIQQIAMSADTRWVAWSDRNGRVWIFEWIH
jgi:WD40 repeat protein